MMKHTVDLAIHPRWIIPMVPRGTILQQLSVIVNKGKIVDILPEDKCSRYYDPKKEVHLKSHVLLPGFVNAHTHTAMYLFKSYGDDNSLSDWLEHYIWPMEKKFISIPFITDGVKMGCAEMIRSGTTCFNDMYYYPVETANLVSKIGMRAVIGLMARDGTGNQNANRAILSSEPSSPLIRFTIAPHSCYLYDEKTLKEIHSICTECHSFMHIHVQETKDELVNSMAGNRQGKGCHCSDAHCSPIENMARLGYLDKACCAHCVHVTDKDIALLAAHSASVVHCPNSNMKLGSGICPVQRMLDAGVNVCLGTDGASSNNNLDMLREMRAAALLGPLADGDAKAVNAVTALEMATIRGARALGLEETIGSVEVGKCADLVAVDMNCIEARPLHNLFSSIVYASGREQVTHVWVDGNALMEEGKLTTLNVEELCEKAKEWEVSLHDENPYVDGGERCSSPFSDTPSS